jgi:carboxypeptidase Q
VTHPKLVDQTQDSTVLIIRMEPKDATSCFARRRCYAKPALVLFLVACLVAAPLPAKAQIPAGKSGESLDLVTISRIRDEGLNRSHAVEYASELADGIGPRLTGSPEFERGARWAIQHLQSMGVADAHEESWGDFGMAWTQIRTTLLLETPSPATLIAQATPWSPSTNGEISAPVVLIPKITNETQLAEYKGKLRGKVVLYGLPSAIDLNPKSPLVQVDDAYFKARMQYPLRTQPSVQEEDLDAAPAHRLLRTVAKFFVDEGALAVLCSPVGDANTFTDDDSSSVGWLVFQKEHKQPIPSAVVAPDAYGRLARLAARKVPVTIKLNIETRFGADPVDGQNVIGEIKGSDPALRDQVVMLGAHLDSWASSTGATDDGAGVVIALEALRILEAVGVKPRRTLRIGLWGGEEEGELGSLGYVNRHFAAIKRESSGPWTEIPEWEGPVVSITPKEDFRDLDVYFNTDAGGGRFYGIYVEDNLAAAAVFRQWIEPVHDLGFDKVSLLSRRGVDSTRFEEAGLPGFHFMQDLRDYDTRTHHTNLDSYERLSEADLKQAATIMAIFALNAAQRDAMIPRKSGKDVSGRAQPPFSVKRSNPKIDASKPREHHRLSSTYALPSPPG